MKPYFTCNGGKDRGQVAQSGSPTHLLIDFFKVRQGLIEVSLQVVHLFQPMSSILFCHLYFIIYQMSKTCKVKEYTTINEELSL